MRALALVLGEKADIATGRFYSCCPHKIAGCTVELRRARATTSRRNIPVA